MEDIEKLHHLYKLKEINRHGIVKGRRESTAEHVYSCMILAEYFLPKIKQKLDELKIMKMLLFHDIVEIEAGDTFVLDKKARITQQKKEANGFKVLKTKIPKELSKEYHKLWREYEAGKTLEAKFCQAIDKLDPILHHLDNSAPWKKYKFTEQKLREQKERYFKEFPVIMKMFNELIEVANKKNYFYREKGKR
ncbi:MAG: HD domain-containing protein [Candidatus Woesearchaeota archaeon]